AAVRQRSRPLITRAVGSLPTASTALLVASAAPLPKSAAPLPMAAAFSPALAAFSPRSRLLAAASLPSSSHLRLAPLKCSRKRVASLSKNRPIDANTPDLAGGGAACAGGAGWTGSGGAASCAEHNKVKA